MDQHNGVVLTTEMFKIKDQDSPDYGINIMRQDLLSNIREVYQRIYEYGLADEELQFWLDRDRMVEARQTTTTMSGLFISTSLALLALTTAIANPMASNLYNAHTWNAIFMHSASMQAAVQMLKCEAIQATWHLYCRQDPVVTIIVRKINDPSPNSHGAPSYSKALFLRRSASRNLIGPDIPIHTPPRAISPRLDPVNLEPCSSVNP